MHLLQVIDFLLKKSFFIINTLRYINEINHVIKRRSIQEISINSLQYQGQDEAIPHAVPINNINEINKGKTNKMNIFINNFICYVF